MPSVYAEKLTKRIMVAVSIVKVKKLKGANYEHHDSDTLSWR